MKTVFFSLILLLFSTPLMAEDIVLEATCHQGGDFGNEIILKLSLNYTYGQLTIKRAQENANYSRDLSTFKGGSYRLDLGSRGGITGYSLQYTAKDATQVNTLDGVLNCLGPNALPTDITEPANVTPPPIVTTPEPTSVTPPPTTPQPPTTPPVDDIPPTVPPTEAPVTEPSAAPSEVPSTPSPETEDPGVDMTDLN